MGNYLTFSSPSSFTLSTKNTAKNWDGTLEYSADANAWNVWDGATTLSADSGQLYLRGTGNKVITGKSDDYRWVLSGSNIACAGNIENLLDYATVANGEHPAMAEGCYWGIFKGCTSLVSAPALPAMTLKGHCYLGMFHGCTSLVNAPSLPATIMASMCYAYMFHGCTSLVNAPSLPATEIPFTASYCYQYMFYNCTSLISIPALPATTLRANCYQYMFEGCTNIKISTTQTEEYCNEYRIPTSGTGTTAENALKSMFANTGGTFTGTPSIDTTYYTANEVIYYEPEEPEEPTATVITYNGETIATLEEGQTATIKTANTEVEHDIVITPVFPIEIAYGDIIATAEAGQTATVKCANTEADFDIVVSAKPIEYTVAGSWVVNNVPQLPTDRIYQEIDLRDGMDYQRKGVVITADDISLISSSGFNGAYWNSSKTWMYSYYQIWKFGKTPKTVSAEFYEWLTANATLDPASMI